MATEVQRATDVTGRIAASLDVDPQKEASASNQIPAVTVHGKKREDVPPMKTVAWFGKHDVRVVENRRPTITDPEDVVLRVTSSCICGSDLHLYEGCMPGMKKGDILGHEFMGVVEEVGPAVSNIKVGDRVVTCFDIACGQCAYCQAKLYSACDATNPSMAEEVMYGHRCGGFFGYSHMTSGWDGGQAEYVRVPFANTNTLKIDASLPDERVILLSDILPTAWHANEMGEVGPGKNVAIWGAGPVGILAAHCAFHRGAARVVIIDRVEYRLEHAAQVIKGLETIDYSKVKVEDALKTMFPQFHGPDVAIEAVGFHYAKTLLHKVEQTLGLETDPSDVLNELIRCVRKGGIVSIVGVYAGYTNHFNIGAMMEKGLTMRGGQTPVQKYWHMLLQKVEAGQLDPTIVITHTLPLEQASHAYKIFNEKTEGCIKVVLKARTSKSGLEPAGATEEEALTSGITP